MTVSPAWDESRAHGRAVPDVDSPQFAADLAATAEKWAAKIKDDPWCLGVFFSPGEYSFKCGTAGCSARSPPAPE